MKSLILQIKADIQAFPMIYLSFFNFENPLSCIKFSNVSKKRVFLIGTVVTFCDSPAGIWASLRTHVRTDGRTYGWTHRRDVGNSILDELHGSFFLFSLVSGSSQTNVTVAMPAMPAITLQEWRKKREHQERYERVWVF